uniref:Artemin n=1 Tax=Coturnix japonica TaxID=93934 RepID=A0A8C2YA57_COTJA
PGLFQPCLGLLPLAPLSDGRGCGAAIPLRCPGARLSPACSPHESAEQTRFAAGIDLLPPAALVGFRGRAAAGWEKPVLQPGSVRDLGLGFNSDEIVLFKYCSGSCHRARSNYDLTLGSLLRQQLIVPGPQERVLSHPCCRPTRYEAVSFMDVQNTWQTVEKLSAAECSCIG